MLSKSATAVPLGSLLLVLVPLPSYASDATPPPGRTVAFTKEAAAPAEHAKRIKELAGIDVDVSALEAKPVALPPEKSEFWPALERLAEATDSRIVTTGGRIALKPGH